jgi:hypothetical protein
MANSGNQSRYKNSSLKIANVSICKIRISKILFFNENFDKSASFKNVKTDYLIRPK